MFQGGLYVVYGQVANLPELLASPTGFEPVLPAWKPVNGRLSPRIYAHFSRIAPHRWVALCVHFVHSYCTHYLSFSFCPRRRRGYFHAVLLFAVFPFYPFSKRPIQKLPHLHLLLGSFLGSLRRTDARSPACVQDW